MAFLCVTETHVQVKIKLVLCLEKKHYVFFDYSKESFMVVIVFQIVILDHQHFYDCDENDHKKLIDKLEKTFGNKLLPCNNIYDMNSITLNVMHEKKYQVSLKKKFLLMF